MNPLTLKDLPPEVLAWIDAYVDGTISTADFDALQDRLQHDPELRAFLRRYLALDNSLRTELGAAQDDATTSWLEPAPVDASKVTRFPVTAIIPAAAAAAVAFFLGAALVVVNNRSGDQTTAAATGSANDTDPAVATVDEPSANGFAVVGRLFETVWDNPTTPLAEGDTLGKESLRLTAGTAEVQFFSGATMTVEGPAEIELHSAWEATCNRGSVRMNVPPAARGFKLHGPGAEIVDLGTEFGFKVENGTTSHVEVFDGEIALTPTGGTEQRLTGGAALALSTDGTATPRTAGTVDFPDLGSLGSNDAAQKQADFLRWQEHRARTAADPSLVAYYTFDHHPESNTITDAGSPPDPELTGAVVLAEPVDGRWPGAKPALEFRRPGARVRVKLPGEFPALSFVAWVRIDSLDRWYNALLMVDGYETGEPHWQIRDDGKLMLSVMVDENARHPHFPDKSRHHHVYFSPPFWDLSMSGQWLHLASVYDPANRQVVHYLNGERLSVEPIAPEFHVDTLRIGNADIGNWSQPIREDPTFAIRNLNGRMDEIAVFKTALTATEIAELYENSRSRGH